MPSFAGALAALMLLLLSFPAGATHRLSVGLAPQFTQLRDDLLPAVRFWGPGGALALGYHHELPSGFSEVVVQGTLTGLSDRFTGSSPGWGLAGGVAVQAQAQQVLWTSQAWTLLLGGVLHAAESLLFASNWDDAHVYWLTDYDLGPAIRIRWQWRSAHALWAQASLPWVSVVGRPPLARTTLLGPLHVPAAYVLETHARMVLMTLDQIFTARAEAAWRIDFDDGWALQAGYALEFISVTQPTWLRALNQSAHVRVLYAL